MTEYRPVRPVDFVGKTVGDFIDDLDAPIEDFDLNINVSCGWNICEMQPPNRSLAIIIGICLVFALLIMSVGVGILWSLGWGLLTFGGVLSMFVIVYIETAAEMYRIDKMFGKRYNGIRHK